MVKLHSFLFILILVIGILSRFLFLDKYPPSLNWDEISHGYNAYSLLQTGKDQWGTKWPIFNFRAYGDFPTTLNLYLTIPFIKLFGLNALSIRLPSAIISLFFIILIYLISKHIFKNTYLALFCMLLAVVSPWNLFLSRAVFQSNFSQTLLLGGLYFFLIGLKNSKLLIISAFSFGLSMYSYHNARIIIPLIVPTIIFFNFIKLKEIYKNNKVVINISLIIFLLLSIPNLINLLSPSSFARNRWVGIINPNSINLINEKRRLFNGPPLFNILLHNKVVYFSQTLIINYLNLLNPLPIFFHGSQNYQFNPPRTGLIFSVLLPFFYIGLIKVFIPSKQQLLFKQLFIYFLICLLPAAITIGDFPSVRATSAIPFYFLFITIGLNSIKYFSRKFLYILLLITIIIQFISYLKTYKTYFQNYSFSWQYGYQPIVNYTKSVYNNYSHIFITKKYGEPHEFFLFYWPWDPIIYQNDPQKIWDYHSDWYWVDRFDKFNFINDWDIKHLQLPNNSLLITSPNNYPQNSKITLLKSINFLDNTTAFEIVAND